MRYQYVIKRISAIQTIDPPTITELLNAYLSNWKDMGVYVDTYTRES